MSGQKVSRKEAENTVTFGDKLPRSPYRDTREILTEPEVSAAGNLIQRVGQEVDTTGRWERHGHVVMTIDEARVYVEMWERAIKRAEEKRNG